MLGALNSQERRRIMDEEAEHGWTQRSDIDWYAVRYDPEYEAAVVRWLQNAINTYQGVAIAEPGTVLALEAQAYTRYKSPTKFKYDSEPLPIETLAYLEESRRDTFQEEFAHKLNTKESEKDVQDR